VVVKDASAEKTTRVRHDSSLGFHVTTSSTALLPSHGLQPTMPCAVCRLRATGSPLPDLPRSPQLESAVVRCGEDLSASGVDVDRHHLLVVAREGADWSVVAEVPDFAGFVVGRGEEEVSAVRVLDARHQPGPAAR
jgi:hypothetical protein